MPQKKHFLFSGLLFSILTLFLACANDKDKNIPDVSAIDAPLKINRFDLDLFAIDTNNVVVGIENLEKKYPEFADFYFKYVLQLKKPGDNGAYREYVNGFLTYPFVRQLHHSVDSVYGNFKPIEKELKQGLQFFKYYFPEKEIPEFYTFVSEFTYGVVIPPMENTIAIGLDLFLGKDYEFYYFPPLNLPKYVGRTQDKAHLTAKIFKGLVDDLMPPQKGNRFIDHIIYNGKKTYILDQLLPHMPDSIKLGYTAQQVEWCENSEKVIWAYFLQEQMMYSDNMQNFKSLVSTAPKSAGMPDESPGEVGNWMGWQIVKAYMKKYPETSLSELIALADVQEILSKSKYKPRR
jgi:hypothetical protein